MFYPHYKPIESEVVKSVSLFESSSKHVDFSSKSELMTYRIIVSTLVITGRLVSSAFPFCYFSDVFIDQCEFVMEPECIVPLVGLVKASCRVVLVGDYMHMGPIILNKLASKYGLGTSLLERLITRSEFYFSSAFANCKTMTKLLNNYRSHSNILWVPNSLFYENEL